MTILKIVMANYGHVFVHYYRQRKGSMMRKNLYIALYVVSLMLASCVCGCDEDKSHNDNSNSSDEESCEANTVKCSEDKLAVLVCDDNGQWKEYVKCSLNNVCDPDLKQCKDKQHSTDVGERCESDTVKCSEDKLAVLVCDNNGQWNEREKCTQNKVCDPDLKQCKGEQSCTPGAIQCKENNTIMVKCSDSGEWLEEEACGNHRICQENVGCEKEFCEELGCYCNSDEYIRNCVDNQLTGCYGDREADGEIIMTEYYNCREDQICVVHNDGEGKRTGASCEFRCTDGALICDYDNNAILECSSSGLWVTQTNCNESMKCYDAYNDSIESNDFARCVSACTSSEDSTEVCCVDFSDESLKYYALRHWDTNDDGCIDKSESLAVTEIPKEAFSNSSQLKSIQDLNVFPNLKTIKNSAFIGCDNLEKAELQHVETIEEGAFFGCDELASVDMPKVKSIGSQAFDECDKLKIVNMPELKTIGSNGFSGTSIEAVDFPDVTYVGNTAFLNCKSLKTVNLPSVVTIAYGGFYQCNQLQRIDFPKAETLEYSTFEGCTSLSEAILPSAKKLGNALFKGASMPMTRLVLTTAEVIDTDSSSFNFDTTNCDLVLHTNKSEATYENRWMGQTWKSISFVNPE